MAKNGAKFFARRSHHPILPRNRAIVADCQDSLNKCNSTQSHPFRIASYNILSQTLLNSNLKLYEHCNDLHLDPEYRWRNLFREIELLDADILCLQEVEKNEEVEKFFHDLGYDISYAKLNVSYRNDGVVLCTRRSALLVEECYHVDFNVDNFSTHVGIVARLRLRDTEPSSNMVFCVATTHLTFNPNAGDVKLYELCCLLAHVKRVASRHCHRQHFYLNRRTVTSCNAVNPDESTTITDAADAAYTDADNAAAPYFPIILCGDFNCEPNSAILRFIEEGKLDLEQHAISRLSGQSQRTFSDCITKDGIFIDWHDFPPASSGITRDCVLMTGVCDPHVSASPNHVALAATTVHDHDYHQSHQDSGPQILTHGLGEFLNTHKYCTLQGDALVTASNCRSSCAVDHIFITHSHGNNDIRLQLQSYWELLTEQQLFVMGGLPNKVSSSDHIPLVADLLLLRGS